MNESVPGQPAIRHGRSRSPRPGVHSPPGARAGRRAAAAGPPPAGRRVSVAPVRAAFHGLLVAALLARSAAATPYETFIDIADQADLDDLLAAGDITSDTYNELLDLLELGVDLSAADRAQLYALPNLD